MYIDITPYCLAISVMDEIPKSTAILISIFFSMSIYLRLQLAILELLQCSVKSNVKVNSLQATTAQSCEVSHGDVGVNTLHM